MTEYPLYRKELGSFYLMGGPSLGGRERIIRMTSAVALAFDLSMDDRGHALLLKHGDPADVDKYVQTYRQKLLKEGSPLALEMAAAIRSITLPTDFDVDELNRCIHSSGYLHSMLQKLCPEALSLDTGGIASGTQ